MRPLVRPTLLAAVLLAAASAPAAAQSYDFDATPLGTPTPLALTSGGVTATFAAAGAPFTVVTASSFLSPAFTGRVLQQPTGTGALSIGFSQTLASISLMFATNGASTLTLDAYLGATLVGTVSGVGTIPSGAVFPEGTLAFSAAAFNNVRLSSSGPTTQFAIDAVQATVATSTTAPEPGSVALLATGLGGLAAAGWRRRRALA
jgi:hypothetical protein